jgi:ketosteroid isomerase-like protein
MARLRRHGGSPELVGVSICEAHDMEALMGTAENKQLLQEIFAETAKGNSRPLVDAMADDFRWIISGNGRWSRSYDGKQAVLTELFPVLRERIEGRIKMIPQRILGDGDHVVVEARGDNVTKAGGRYDNSYCFVFRLAGGKLVEAIEYMDSELVTSTLGAPNG